MKNVVEVKVSYREVAFLSLMTMPLWWFMGFDFFVYHFFAFLMILLRPSLLFPKTLFDFGLLVVVLSLAISVFIASLMGGGIGGRVFPAINNLSIVVVSYIYFRASFDIFCDVSKGGGEFKYAFEKKSCFSYFFKLSLVTVVISLVLFFYSYVQGAVDIEITTFYGSMNLPDKGLLGEYVSAKFIDKDWLFGQRQPRINLYAPFATGTAMLLIALFSLASLSCSLKNEKALFIFLFIAFLVVLLTLTRAAVFGYLFGLLVYYFLNMFKNRKDMIFSIVLPSSIILGSLFFFSLPYISEMRQGSSSARYAVYYHSIVEVWNRNPLFGLGVKPRIEGFSIPLGSHSSLLSIFVRSGFVGVSGFLIMFFSLLALYAGYILRCVFCLSQESNANSVLGRLVIGVPSVLFFFLLQDFDAYPVVSAYLFFYLGAVYAVQKRS